MHRLFVSNHKTGIVQNYLWADLVATLSNLQMYNFTHDDQATVQLWGSDSNEPSYTPQVMMSSVMTGSECFKKATVIEFTCSWITIFSYWECLPVLFSASKSYILQIHEYQFINHLSSNGLGSLVTMDELLKKKFQWHWEA